MKNHELNQQKINLKTFKLLVFKVKLLLFYFVLTSSLSYSQVSKQGTSIKNDDAQKILEVKQYIQSLKDFEHNNKVSYSTHKRLLELLYNVQPSIYCLNTDEIKKYGDKPTNLFTNVSSLLSIKNSKNYQDIEIVTIYLNSNKDLKTKIDLLMFKSFNKLKYVNIVCNVVASEQEIFEMIENLTPIHVVFYSFPKDDNY